jgi:hypothetical protein
MKPNDPFYPVTGKASEFYFKSDGIKPDDVSVVLGISVRDELAARMAQGFISDAAHLDAIAAIAKSNNKIVSASGGVTMEQINQTLAKMAYEIADALIEESNK